MKLAILDDYQNIALVSADWSSVSSRCEIQVFNQPFSDPQQVIAALEPFDIICCMRERTPFPASVLEQLPQLKLLVTTGAKNAAIDFSCAKDQGIEIATTDSPGHAAAELAWGLLMSLAKNIHLDNQTIRQGVWQSRMASDIKGQTLGIVGLGRHGRHMARFAQAFGMRCLAWSENLTQASCEQAGVDYVSKEELLCDSDFISIHLKMGSRNRDLMYAEAFRLMIPSAFLINTSRGPIVNESAMIQALRSGSIAGVGLDVYDLEPLAIDHPLLSFDNALLTPHTGFVTHQTYHVFYTQTVDRVLQWLTTNT